MARVIDGRATPEDIKARYIAALEEELHMEEAKAKGDGKPHRVEAVKAELARVKRAKPEREEATDESREKAVGAGTRGTR